LRNRLDGKLKALTQPDQTAPPTAAGILIRWFGERAKIFNVHFRNIKGRKLDFMEALPDEGDMDMPRALAAHRDVGYPYMLMPDHVPRIDGRDPSGVAFAYCYGYIQALLDALVPRSGPTTA
jgi:mannonate dehydratase